MKILGRILLIDDEKNITLVVSTLLEKAGYEVVFFNDSRLALEALKDEEFDTVITDMSMPHITGLEILEYCQKNLPELPVVIITAFGTVEIAVQSLKKGAFDFISKPFDKHELLNVVQKAVNTGQKNQGDLIASEAMSLDSSPLTKNTYGMIGASDSVQEVYRVISKIANSPATVLISGESGTGKELVAIQIHKRSDRSEKPFIKINCGAIPATLIESELFGYERGAFTGAVTSKPGKFELAHEGTIFLDEVAEMPLEMQVKLLRVIQEKEIERVGGVQVIPIDVRIVTATNKNLADEVKQGRFREDLFYRLNVVPIHLPPLRERREDIQLLAEFFLKKHNVKLKKNFKEIDEPCMNALIHWNWPGNIRQLEHVIERMILMAEEPFLKVIDLPDEILESLPTENKLISKQDLIESDEPESFKEIVRRKTQAVERELIEKALNEAGGNVTRTAERLGLSRKGLQLKLKELGIRTRGND